MKEYKNWDFLKTNTDSLLLGTWPSHKDLHRGEIQGSVRVPILNHVSLPCHCHGQLRRWQQRQHCASSWFLLISKASITSLEETRRSLKDRRHLSSQEVLAVPLLSLWLMAILIKRVACSSYFNSPNFFLLLGRIFYQLIKQVLVAVPEQNG